MKQYLEALQYVIDHGTDSDDRTGVGTRKVFGYQTRFNLQDGFPAVTTKKLAFKSVVSELLWFLEGSTDERRLAELRHGMNRKHLVDKTTIWTDNADAQGADLGWENTDLVKELGPVYGNQWRSWPSAKHHYDSDYAPSAHDQITTAIDTLKKNPNSRRNIVSAWNVDDLDSMALPPCHTLFQFNVRPGGKGKRILDCQLYQRSCDLALGAPFNIASYALLMHIVAKHVGMEVGDFVYTLGDMHIYKNHIDGIREQLKRTPLPLPTLSISHDFSLNCMYGQFPLDSVDRYFRLNNYEHYDSIKFNMAV